ncbi:S-layer homology domain-containing protein [Collinsella ihumii]|uniref:S-layer homology domain-containing protein n=1 Tax=Collinsella ihumii TaxID=1720204 RepID=A0ABT7XHG5_9ACTN|nr:S-layer homology domain-containing protein [Collinsella ihumii]MDN0064753.1 S-layer homology domain-containing protein [Collinsella ihumii]
MRINDKACRAIVAGLASVTVAAAAFAPATAYAAYKSYHDVPADHWAATSGVIDWADRNGVINGFPDGSWGADQPVNRAQAAAILYNLAGQPAVSGEPRFDDASELGWAKTAATWAQQQGIFSGTVHADGRLTFDPWDSLTREQAAKILCVLAGNRAGNTSVLNRYQDAGSVSEWAREVVAWAVQAGVMGNGGALNGNQPCTRSEFVSMTKTTDSRFLHYGDEWDDDWDLDDDGWDDDRDDWDDDWDDDRYDDDDDQWDDGWDDDHDDNWDDDHDDGWDDDRFDDDWDDDRDDNDDDDDDDDDRDDWDDHDDDDDRDDRWDD